MGEHAFQVEPPHHDLYRRVLGFEPPKLFGFDQKWNMPVVRHQASLAGGPAFAGVPHYVLTYHISGPPVRRIDHPQFTQIARTGALSLQHPQSSGQYASEVSGPVTYAHFYFTEALVKTVANQRSVALPPNPVDWFGVVDLCLQTEVQTYLRLASSRQRDASIGEMDLRAELIVLGILRISNAMSRSPGSDVNYSALSGGIVDTIHRHVVSRLGEYITVAELAEIARMSSSHFSRVFKQRTGVSPASFVLNVRLETAASLLLETGKSINEIAHECGFSSQAHFSRVFSARFSVPPSKFRQQSRSG